MESSCITGTFRTAETREDLTPAKKGKKEQEQSFQKKVLQELLLQDPPSRKAALCELAAIITCAAGGECRGRGTEVELRFPRNEVRNKCFTLIGKTFNITVELGSTPENSGGRENNGSGEERGTSFYGEAARQMMELMKPPVHFEQDAKCVRSYLAGCFLYSGFVRDPRKEYYLSFDIPDPKQAQEIVRLLGNAGVVLHQAESGKGHTLFTRDSGTMADILNLLGAHVSMMELENARIMKQVRGRINRKVNCETANIMKTVAASQKQMEEIDRIRKSSIWDTLPESLQQIALLREKYPESSLQELGKMLNPPVGKSGVNHRLRRLSALAEDLQKKDTDSPG